MQWYEVDACLKGLDMIYKQSWEQTRFISYITAQVNTSKKLKPTDILSFKWDKVEPTDTAISDIDIERLKHKANTMKNKI